MNTKCISAEEQPQKGGEVCGVQSQKIHTEHHTVAEVYSLNINTKSSIIQGYG